MSAIARSVRPFASRVLSQKLPLSGVGRVSPAAGFPRGSARSFSQSPFLALKKYAESHEWIELAADGKTAKVGITEYAAKSLGDVVFVELPEIDAEVNAHDPVGAVESVKSASDVHSPAAGRVTKVNTVLEDNAKFINESPEGEAWIAEIEVSDPAELDSLLDAAAYKELVDEESN
ncbi:glycine cleavage H-protein-domain-containing protein [Aspergillus bertholletiae]|uniref:Glycine cleavage system H protein n=1 Tax=Aspergillus bertholletiae TaxID=1226010 RepID=A0A5N7BAS9_9EURO|nr:glycine cleavage H-protein-domain-containing protein [Aspergillus bertholletiae]